MAEDQSLPIVKVNETNMEEAMSGIPQSSQDIASKWFAALSAGRVREALGYLDDNITWINNPPEKGLNDIIPWLGEYHGREAVAGTFEVWGRLSEVQRFEVRDVVTSDTQVLARVHEVARIKATGLCYDIEFIQRFTVRNGLIVFWTSYWDTAKGIVPFRGDFNSRLIIAAKCGSVDDAIAVLPYGATPNIADPGTGQTPLMIAAGRGDARMVEVLLRFGADPNAVDARAGATALHKACQGGDLVTVQLLAGAGANLDHQVFTTGHTPLVEAIWYKRDQIAGFLISKGVRTEIKTYYGFTVDDHIDYALRVNKGNDAAEVFTRIQRLIAVRRRKDARTKCSQTLNDAVLAGEVSEVRQAIDRGEDIEETFPVVGTLSDGHTPLLIAARDGHAEIVQVLLSAGANVNAVEPIFGAVPLHKATYNGNLEITKMLASAVGIDLDYQGPTNGYTPLHDALWHGFAECAEVLIDSGARLDLVAYDGKKPIDIAIEELGADSKIAQKLKTLIAS